MAKTKTHLVDHTNGLPAALIEQARAMEDKWRKVNKARRVPERSVSAKRGKLLGKEYRYGFIPCEDHAEMWLCDRGQGEQPRLVFHPYVLHDIDRLVAFCKERSLRCRIYGDSFYYPGRTLRVEIEPYTP